MRLKPGTGTSQRVTAFYLKRTEDFDPNVTSLKMGAHSLIFCMFATLTCLSLESPPNCDEVRKVFQQRQIGPVQSLPDKPRKGMNDFVIQFT